MLEVCAFPPLLYKTRFRRILNSLPFHSIRIMLSAYPAKTWFIDSKLISKLKTRKNDAQRPVFYIIFISIRDRTAARYNFIAKKKLSRIRRIRR